MRGLKYEREASAAMLAIAGGKGGAGKTTTTLGLAAAAADRTGDGGVLAVDADVDMPNLHAMAGVETRSTDPSREADRPVGLPHPSVDRLRIVPAPRQDGGDVPARLRDLSANRVFVDCPAGAGPDAVAPMRVADAVLVVSSLCGPALRDAAKTVAMARAVGTTVVGGVLTRTRRVPDGVERLLDCPVLDTVPEAPAGTDPLLTDVVRAAYARLTNRLVDAEEL